MRSTISGTNPSATAETLAGAALSLDGLMLRSLAQDLVRQYPQLASIPRPQSEDRQILGTAAALMELLALRHGQMAPDWTRAIGKVPRPMFLVAAANRMENLRALCEAESPEPLKKRGLYAPPDFLKFV
ncbi:MAG: hypothetical protein H0T47_00150 [Planctomycetaceae bacterium]|nr:hypothetical protein [Planctomycetaceae bacterium]